MSPSRPLLREGLARRWPGREGQPPHLRSSRCKSPHGRAHRPRPASRSRPARDADRRCNRAPVSMRSRRDTQPASDSRNCWLLSPARGAASARLPDGVFARVNGAVEFVALSAPSPDEVLAVLGRIVARLMRLLRPRLLDLQADATQPDALGAAQAESLHSLGTPPATQGRADKRSAFLQGFSLHAGVHLHANDRQGLEHLCGYGARPPFSQQRLTALPDGRLAYQLIKAPARRRPHRPSAAADRASAPPGPAGSASASPPRPLPRRLRPRRLLAPRGDSCPRAAAESTAGRWTRTAHPHD
jgi:hypothetical protein